MIMNRMVIMMVRMVRGGGRGACRPSLDEHGDHDDHSGDEER